MRKLDLGKAIGITANISVVAGIVFLALELRQNTDAQRSQMRLSQNERETEVIEELFRNPLLNSAYVKFTSHQPLSDEEDLALSAYSLRIFLSWNWIYGEVQAGNMEPGLLDSFPRVFHNFAAGGYDAQLLVHYWPAYEQSVSSDFREWMEDRVVNH